MKFNLNKKGGLSVKLVFEGQDIDCEKFKALKSEGLFTGKFNEVFVSSFKDAAFVGLGKEEELTTNKAREIFFHLAKELKAKHVEEVEMEVKKLNGICNGRMAAAAVEGMLQSEYKFDKSTKKCGCSKRELTVNYLPVDAPEAKYEKIQRKMDEAKSLIDSIFITRDLVNLPANFIYPESLAKRAKEILEPAGVKVTVYDKAQVEALGMEAFLAVGKGSDNELRLIVMEYLNDPESDEKLALVGKGITYDSGGYSIKPNDGMVTMFCDMAGGATVIGALHAIATNKVKANVVGVIAACENAVSGHSYKPGDIVGSLSGKTIEIGNTDAEGRVTLADSVYYAASNLKATKIIDLATLTGACLIALGEVYTGSVTNNQEFYNELLEASEKAGEKIWQLPLDPEFGKLNKSKVADVKNIGGRFAGTITAGMFIAEFNNNLPWIHLDIAGTAFLSNAYSYLPERATGVHVKTLYNLVADHEVNCGNKCSR